MASSIRAAWAGLADTQRDLDAVEHGIGRLVPAAVAAAAEPIVARARALTPVGPGPRGPGDALPHIAATLYAQPRGSGAAIVSTHPGGPVLEYGGTIAPRGTPITIKSQAMAHRAADATLAAVDRDLEQRLNALLREHGLAG